SGAMQQAISVLESRVNGTGNSAAQVQQQGSDLINVSVPGGTAESTIKLVSTTAQLRFRQVLLVEPYSGSAARPAAHPSGSATPHATPTGSASAAGKSTSPKASTAALSARHASPSASPTATPASTASATPTASASPGATPSPTATGPTTYGDPSKV